jgi:hypothetical protein
MHQKRIIDDGFGYAEEIGNLMSVFKKYNIEADDAFKFFEKRILTEKYENIEDTLVKFLSDNGVKKAKDCVLNLSYNESRYAIFLDKL